MPRTPETSDFQKAFDHIDTALSALVMQNDPDNNHVSKLEPGLSLHVFTPRHDLNRSIDYTLVRKSDGKGQRYWGLSEVPPSDAPDYRKQYIICASIGYFALLTAKDDTRQFTSNSSQNDLADTLKTVNDMVDICSVLQIAPLQRVLKIEQRSREMVVSVAQTKQENAAVLPFAPRAPK